MRVYLPKASLSLNDASAIERNSLCLSPLLNNGPTPFSSCARVLEITTAHRQPSEGRIALSGLNHFRTNVATAKASWSISISNVRFRASGFEFHSGFFLQFSVFGVRSSVFGFRFTGFGFRVLGFWFRDWGCLGNTWLRKT